MCLSLYGSESLIVFGKVIKIGVEVWKCRKLSIVPKLGAAGERSAQHFSEVT